MAISATKDKIAVSLREKIKNIGKKNLDVMFEKNPYMKEIYPGDTRDAIEVFWLQSIRSIVCIAEDMLKSALNSVLRKWHEQAY